MKWILVVAVLLSDGKEIEIQADYSSPDVCAEKAAAFVEHLAWLYEGADVAAQCVQEASI